MSVINVIYDILAKDPLLNVELARSVFDETNIEPAIYEFWPGQNAVMPYLITAYNFPQGSHWAKVNGALTISVYVDNRDTVKAESIKNRCIELLEQQYIRSSEDGLVRLYKGPNDQPGGTESPEVVHWLIDFDIRFWRQNAAIK